MLFREEKLLKSRRELESVFTSAILRLTKQIVLFVLKSAFKIKKKVFEDYYAPHSEEYGLVSSLKQTTLQCRHSYLTLHNAAPDLAPQKRACNLHVKMSFLKILQTFAHSV